MWPSIRRLIWASLCPAPGCRQPRVAASSALTRGCRRPPPFRLPSNPRAAVWYMLLLTLSDALARYLQWRRTSGAASGRPWAGARQSTGGEAYAALPVGCGGGGEGEGGEALEEGQLLGMRAGDAGGGDVCGGEEEGPPPRPEASPRAGAGGGFARSGPSLFAPGSSWRRYMARWKQRPRSTLARPDRAAGPLFNKMA